MQIQLERKTFELNRAAEYFNTRELSAQTGQPEREFPNVILKELIDNAIDAAEVVTQPAIDINIDDLGGDQRVTVADNGPGIDPETVTKILNFNTRTSSKQAYRSPTRGAQGNALKTIIGIPYALTGDKTGIEIISRNIRHEISVELDPAGVPVVKHETHEHKRSQGASFSTTIPKSNYFRPLYIVNTFTCFNPHVDFTYNSEALPAAISDFKKVLENDPTCIYWYSKDDFKKLIYAHIAETKISGEDKTIKQFISEFRGLSSRQKIKDAAIDLKYLSELHDNESAINELFENMKAQSRPASPNILGAVGGEHFQKYFSAIATLSGEMKYKMVNGEVDGVPFIVEVAFSEINDGLQEYAGINHSMAYNDPFADCVFTFSDRKKTIQAQGLFNMARRLYDPEGVFIEHDYILTAHLITPRLDFTDRGKTRPIVNDAIREAAEKCLIYCMKEVYHKNKKVVREFEQYKRKEEQHEKAINAEKMTKREAVFMEIEEAIRQATGNYTLPASYRSVFYKIRPLIQKYDIKTRKTKRGLNYDLTLDNFRNLLKEYFQEHGANPLIYAEPRGYLIEPHTGKRVDMGTREVNQYIIPVNLYNKILYVEKLGLLPVFEAAKLAERFDCAIIGGQGYAVDAVKMLLSEVESETNIAICVLTDADPAGYEIRRTLQEETRFTPGHNIEVYDFGLTIAEAEAWQLPSERARQDRRLSSALVDRLTDKEKEYFLPAHSGRLPYIFERIELNAFASDQMISYIENQFARHGLQAKVDPGEKVINEQAADIAAGKLQDEIRQALIERLDLDSVVAKIYGDCTGLNGNIYNAVAGELSNNPPESWENILTKHAERAARDVYFSQAADMVKNVKINESG